VAITLHEMGNVLAVSGSLFGAHRLASPLQWHVQQGQGMLDAALHRHEEALGIFRARGDGSNALNCLHAISAIHLVRTRHTQAPSSSTVSWVNCFARTTGSAPLS
jgi:hypothetical protein